MSSVYKAPFPNDNIADSDVNILNADLVVREKSNPTFSVYAANIDLANNKSMLSIVNTSTLKIRIKEIHLINSRTTAVTGVAADFRLFRCTGHSAGTLLTANTLDSSLAALDSGVTLRTNGTIAGESTNILFRWLLSSDEWGPGTLDKEGLDNAFQLFGNPAIHSIPGASDLVINQNQGITLKNTTNTNAGTFDVFMIFTQE